MGFDISEELKKLPDQPGVYLMHDAHDEIIYVGKARVLKNRVRSYFQPGYKRSPKIEHMVSHVAYFEYIITDSELEALVLECNLIKEHRPHYNTMLKDDKTYPYIKVTVQEDFPRLIYTRQVKRDKARYFGPYTGPVKDTLELLRRVYKIRNCNRSLPQEIGKDRPCLYYHMGQCDAPCQGKIDKEEYRKFVEAAMTFLSGDDSVLIRELTEKMQKAAAEMAFEEAASYRDLIENVKRVAEKQKMHDPNADDKDIIAVAKEQDDAVVVIFFMRNGKLLGREHFHMSGVTDTEEKEVLTDFVKQYYMGTPYIPREIHLQTEIDDQEIMESWLAGRRGSKVTFVTPKRGEKKRLVTLAGENARNVLSKDREKILREEQRTLGAVKELEQLTGIRDIHRMEAFDISNTNGYENVASMVVFEQGKPKRSDYRRFRIRTVAGPDDYACMEEVLTRRFLHGMKEMDEIRESEGDPEIGSFTRFPDVIMMDGGKGQVNVAEAVLAKLSLDIPVCGMVKDDNHRTRGLYYKGEEIAFPRNAESFRLVTRLQDEAHRFAITYHKALRGQKQVHSVLDDIKGIGPARRKALMKYYKDIAKIKDAEEAELAEVPGMNKAAAAAVYAFFHQS